MALLCADSPAGEEAERGEPGDLELLVKIEGGESVKDKTTRVHCVAGKNSAQE